MHVFSALGLWRFDDVEQALAFVSDYWDAIPPALWTDAYQLQFRRT
jgi:hypothetical protein